MGCPSKESKLSEASCRILAVVLGKQMIHCLNAGLPQPLSVAVWLDIVMSYRPGMPVMFSLVFLGCSTMTHYFIKKDHILGKVEMKETSCFYASSVCYNKKKSERFVWVLLPISNLWCFAEEFVFVIGSQKVY